MHVLIFEPFAGGHHTNYVAALLPTLADLIEVGGVERATVAVTAPHFEAMERAGLLELGRGRVEFDTSPAPASARNSLSQRRIVAENLANVVRRLNADAVISTTADHDGPVQALDRLRLRRVLPRSVASAGVFHYGYAGAVRGWKDWLRHHAYAASWRGSCWDHVMMVNPVVFEAMRSRGALKRRLHLLPDPVPTASMLARAEARRRLGVPTDGTYLGYIGQMDERKAIPELLAAFASARLPDDTRLLLAGKLDARFRQLVDDVYPALVKHERLLVIDRPLSEDELWLGLAAVEVVTVLQYHRPNLSANLLKALSAQRPVIVDDYGYTGFITRRFETGWRCDITQPETIARAMEAAVAEHGDYEPSAATQRLLAFHDPRNFAMTALRPCWRRFPAEWRDEVRTWDWVNGGSRGA